MNNSTLKVLQQELDNAAATVLRVAGRIGKAIGEEPPAPTVKSTYGKPVEQLTPPKGWVFTGEFRAEKDGESYLGVGALGQVESLGDRHLGARLILRRANRITLEETGEVRKAGPGEYYFSPDGFLLHGSSCGHHPIYRRLPDKE